MIRQYYAQRFRPTYPSRPSGKSGSITLYSTDPRDKRIGTIPVGTILYIQDGVRPFRDLERPLVRRNPWIVEAWIPREYSKLDGRGWTTVRIAGGHLAQVRSLRDRRRMQLVADWILLQCMDAGLEKA